MSRNQVSNARRLIVRYVREHQLQRGDRLPSHAFFREQYGFGTVTVSAAVDELRQAGFLEVRDKVGVFILNPRMDGYYGYVVGIMISAWIHGTPYYSSLLNAIHMSLIQSGCNVQFFFARPTPSGMPYLAVSHIPNLIQSLKKKELDALIHIDPLKETERLRLMNYGIPVMAIGITFYQPENSYLLYNPSSLLRRMLADFSQRGVRRPALFLPPVIQEISRDFMEQTDGRGILMPPDSYEHPQQMISYFLNMKKEEQPDGIIFLDDLAALKILCAMTQIVPPEDMPEIAILENRQLFLHYPVRRCTRYISDLEKVAEKAVSLLQDNLKKGILHFDRRFHEEITSEGADLL